jgi:hypothetical protein
MGKNKVNKLIIQRYIGFGLMKFSKITRYLLGSYTGSIELFKLEQGYILDRFHCSDQRVVERMNLTLCGLNRQVS